MSETKSMYKGLLIFGIAVFILGLFCIFYREVEYYNPLFMDSPIWNYPYKDIGRILIIAGILLVTLGFISAIVSPRKSEGS